MKNPEIRKKISQKVLDSYKNPELMEKRRKHFIKLLSSPEYRKRREELNDWIPLENLNEFEQYKRLVISKTKKSFDFFNRDIPNSEMRSREYHLDHKYSISEGFRNKIHPMIIGHYKNLEVVYHAINESKFIECSITLDELVNGIQLSKDKLSKNILEEKFNVLR